MTASCRTLSVMALALLVMSAGNALQRGVWDMWAFPSPVGDLGGEIVIKSLLALRYEPVASYASGNDHSQAWQARLSHLLRPLPDLLLGWSAPALSKREGAGLIGSADGTIEVPGDFATIQEAIDAACPGDTIEVKSGIYRENIDVHEQLTLKGIDSGQGRPVIDARGWVSGVTLRKDGIILAGFIITNSSLGAGVDIQSDCNVIIDNNITNNTINGLKFRGRRQGNIVSQNQIVGNGFSGVSFEGESVDNTVLDNEIQRNGFGGVTFGEEAHSNLITENNISQNGFVGVQFKARSMDNYVLENKVLGNNFGGIDLLGNASCNLITGNLLVRNNFTGLSLSKNTSCNRVFRNYLFQNMKHGASDEGSDNRWDDEAAGNYHSDFQCEDKDKNGICDSAFGIYGGMGSDRFPLANIPEELARTIPAG